MINMLGFFGPSFETRYLGPTNYRGSRVRVTSSTGKTKVFPWCDALDSSANHSDAAKAFAASLGFSGDMVEAEAIGGRGYVYVFCRRDYPAV